jgi:hypothetical protein
MTGPSFTQYRPLVEVADLLERGHRIFICGCGRLAAKRPDGDRHVDDASLTRSHDADVVPIS